MRILLVEDEIALRETVRESLMAAGHEVAMTADGDAALACARRKPFDLGIINLGPSHLPRAELVRNLREFGLDFPILVMAAYTSWEEKIKGLKQGADDYLAKPFAFAELLARVQALAARPSARSRPPERA